MQLNSLLVVWKWISTDPPIEETCIIGVLADRTKVEHPVVLPVSVFQELFGILPSVTIPAFYARSRVPHDDDLVGKIDQICDRFRER